MRAGFTAHVEGREDYYEIFDKMLAGALGLEPFPQLADFAKN